VRFKSLLLHHFFVVNPRVFFCRSARAGQTAPFPSRLSRFSRADQARTFLLVAPGGEPSVAAVVWRHTAQDCDTAVASGIGGLRGGSRSRLSCRDGEVSAKSMGKTAFLGVEWPRDAKPTHPGAAGSAVDQNCDKTLPKEAVWSIGGVEIGESKRKFRFVPLIASLGFAALPL
jgi:hypothetical protein